MRNFFSALRTDRSALCASALRVGRTTSFIPLPPLYKDYVVVDCRYRKEKKCELLYWCSEVLALVLHTASNGEVIPAEIPYIPHMHCDSGQLTMHIQSKEIPFVEVPRCY